MAERIWPPRPEIGLNRERASLARDSASPARGANLRFCPHSRTRRTVYCGWRTRFAQYGADGVIPKRRVITVALAWPTCGPQFVRDWLAREGLVIAAVTVWRVLRRHQLGMRLRRLAVLEQHSADTQGLLTERTARALCKTRHVEADVPGELLSLDTFYVG